MKAPSLCAVAALCVLPWIPRSSTLQVQTPFQGLVRPSTGFCAGSIDDQASGGCIQASTAPGLGRLYPLSQQLWVDGTTGFVGIGTLAPASRLHVEGTTTTRVLTITGGADLVESFDTAGADPEPGTVLVVDSARPGLLAVSARAYDRRVAGVVSGAGGVQPGIALGQPGLQGDTQVALGGRVYVRCTAENGPIAPGDLLTTADTAGHAMRASAPERTFGAVLGKALTPLESGTGLVLALVSLQ
jgi:hypothetical protein